MKPSYGILNSIIMSSHILYSNCSPSWIILDLVLRIFDLIVFLSSILLHMSVDSHVLSVLLRYPRVFFALLQYTSLIWFHFPFTCDGSVSSVPISYFQYKCFQYLVLLESGYVVFPRSVLLGGSFP